MSSNLIALQNRFLRPGQTLFKRLTALRESNGAITSGDVESLARELSLPIAYVRSVAQFYDELSFRGAKREAVRVCAGEACAVAGASQCRDRLERELSTTASAEIGTVTCLGYCGSGPNAELRAGGAVRVASLSPEGALVEVVSSIEADRLPNLTEPVNSIVRSKSGPEVLFSYLCPRGAAEPIGAAPRISYPVLSNALGKNSEAIIDAVKSSGLRGRGGAGFPTGIKMETVRNAPSPGGERFVVLNADEGDAGAYIDKELIERSPHTVIESVLLAAYAVGATAGWIYLRGEYPHAHRVLGEAIAEARDSGLLGGGILGTGFSFDLEVVQGQGSYVCGEETALLRSLEGLPGQVTPKPPYPAVEGLHGKPTLVNNVETLANLPFIVERGGESYAALGYGKSRGTKLVSLNTAVARPGLYEVEFGTSLHDIIFDRAGGMADGKRFKALQIGGPLGGFFSENQLDLPLDFEALDDAGGLLGHGGMVVYPEEVDLVAIGRELIRFCAQESCGKCFPCRIGATRGVELFDKIIQGRGGQSDLELLAELMETMRQTSLCALGGGIYLPICSLLNLFLDEFNKYVPEAVTPRQNSALASGGCR